MKKLFLLIFVSMVCATSFAQRNVQPQKRGARTAKPTVALKKHAFYVGVKGGINLSSMSQPDECDLYDGSGLGFSGGAVGKVRFNQASPNSPAGTGLFGAGIELNYKQNKVKTIAFDEKDKAKADLSLNYFEVPVYAQIYPFFKSDAMNTFHAEFGVSFLGSLSSSPEILKESSANVTYKTGDLKGFDVRPFAGLGYIIPKTQLEINARYYYGTSKLAGNFPCKMSCTEVSLSWMFNVGKL